MASSTFQIQNLRSGAIRLLLGADGGLVNLVATLQRRVSNRAKIRAPVDTGYLRNSHEYNVPVVVGLRVSGEVRATARYAAALHDGTPARVIRPRNAKALRFIGRDGQVVFRRSVNMPARPGRPWLLMAFREEAPRLGFEIRER